MREQRQGSKNYIRNRIINYYVSGPHSQKEPNVLETIIKSEQKEKGKDHEEAVADLDCDQDRPSFLDAKGDDETSGKMTAPSAPPLIIDGKYSGFPLLWTGLGIAVGGIVLFSHFFISEV